ncbi:AbrB family transcriptional regulator [Rhizobium leguminosarum bv. viciae]|uniref:AbrB family transcriptional regulator n=1 Tax=Rhizobium leguminosarum TaxID=384 RepID=UPI0010407DB9|nr:AbrB family transcriptional regulator [Rhizobium leguminosarum]MBY5339789.1 AbrB family transcriptional regulator [Rhizobium leguminosarum]NKK48690.1 AbrB family transcriptional regulator [Rhizobium leguminosarum bv. viciae]TBY95906.1 AbrB family transcriptional regulator [Rhizobium leguminosarum bv. viciae]
MSFSDASRLLRDAGLPKWALLLALSTALVVFLELFALPASLLIGPMVAAIALALTIGKGKLRVPFWSLQFGQVLVGLMMARTITPDILGTMAKDAPLFLLFIFSVIAIATGLGWLLTRWQVLPGTTAVWGSSPGGASAMVIMSEAYGADARLVAFMQYLRVVFVAVGASVVSRLWVAADGAEPPPLVLFPEIDWPAFAATMAFAAFCAYGVRRLRLQGGTIIVPLFLGALLQGMGLLKIELPMWLLAIAYALVGWSIGLRFTRSILKHVARALPRVSACIVLLMALCGCMAVALHVFAGIDPLTAYLATSPGGADSVAIIAASSDVDVPFVMAMQTGRFLVILMIGPTLARFIARRSGLAENPA